MREFRSPLFSSTSACAFLAAVCSLVCGCDVPIKSFAPNKLYVARMERSQGADLQPAVADSTAAIVELFGTPDEPKWPECLLEDEELARLVDSERLYQAGGAVRSDEHDVHFGLFREHCVHCHGVTGDGLGPTSRFLSPYARDFRLGKFKFKSTPIGKKPTRDDLRRTLSEGVAGTSMPSFRLLKDAELEALIDYVIYLSVRGEVERQLLTDAALELDYEAGDRLLDVTLKTNNEAEYDLQWKRIEAQVVAVAENWAEAEQAVLQVNLPPADYPLFDRDNQGTSEQKNRLAASVANGDKLFHGSIANCFSCHGAAATGDGQSKNFDAWTKDWTEGLDPLDRQQIRPLLKLGALKPSYILPRNLRNGVFRGGSKPSDLYLRIVNGIDGTPMPAAPLKPDNPLGLSTEEVWDLVNYLLSLPHQYASSSASATSIAPTNTLEAK